jgi:HKD family nuclease
MEFLASKGATGKAFTKALKDASKVRIASAFFCPTQKTLDLLNTVVDLTLVISEEFTINDPAKLESLTKAAKRSIPADSQDGKLHAKVFIADVADGSTWVLVGSANLTEQGLFYNEEAGMALSSKNVGDRSAINEIKAWFAVVLQRSRLINLHQAKAIWDARSKQRLTKVSNPHQAAPSYWALKTTEGSGPDAPEHWPMFESESVIAIGWEAVTVDPSAVDDDVLWNAVNAAYPALKPRSKNYAVNTIRDFASLPIGSIVMVCHGYAPNTGNDNPVHIYAFARVTGEVKPTPHIPGVWRFRRAAVLQKFNKTLPVYMMRKLLNSGSLMQTLHLLEQSEVEAVAAELGIQIDV